MRVIIGMHIEMSKIQERMDASNDRLSQIERRLDSSDAGWRTNCTSRTFTSPSAFPLVDFPPPILHAQIMAHSNMDVLPIRLAL